MFKDPYKNIHGQTVESPMPDQPNNPEISNYTTNTQRRSFADSGQQNAGTANRIIAVFIVMIIVTTTIPALFMFILSTIFDAPIELNAPNGSIAYVNPNLKDTYSFSEISKQFAFSGGKAVFTETPDIKAKITNGYDTIYLTHEQTESDSITVNIANYQQTDYDKIRSNCKNGTRITALQCEEVKNIDDFDSDKELLLCDKRIGMQGEEDLCNYELYSPLDPDNTTSNYVHITYIPVSIYRQSADESLSILKKVRATISKSDGTIPRVDEMMDRCDLFMPPNKADRNYRAIDFKNQYYIYDAYEVANDYTSPYYVITVSSKIGYTLYSKIDSLSNPKIDVYSDNSGDVFFELYPADGDTLHKPSYITIRKHVSDESGRTKSQLVTSAEEMLDIIYGDVD